MSDEGTAAEATRAATAVTATKRVLSGVELKALAADGGFAVDETTGDHMVDGMRGNSVEYAVGKDANATTPHVTNQEAAEMHLMRDSVRNNGVPPTYDQELDAIHRQYGTPSQADMDAMVRGEHGGPDASNVSDQDVKDAIRVNRERMEAMAARPGDPMDVDGGGAGEQMDLD
jgi:phage portal protein BeeE